MPRRWLIHVYGHKSLCITAPDQCQYCCQSLLKGEKLHSERLQPVQPCVRNILQCVLVRVEVGAGLEQPQ